MNTAQVTDETGGRYLEAVTFTDPWRTFAAGETIEFRAGVNLLVGDQGAGKPSLIAAPRTVGKKPTRRIPPATFTLSESVPANMRLLSFDFEVDNPRAKSRFDDTFYMRSQVEMRFMSHGEAVLSILEGAGSDELAVYILDQPDTALSPRSVRRLATVLGELEGARHQIIAADRNPIVIGYRTEVLSLEHHRWMPKCNSTGSVQDGRDSTSCHRKRRPFAQVLDPPQAAGHNESPHMAMHEGIRTMSMVAPRPKTNPFSSAVVATWLRPTNLTVKSPGPGVLTSTTPLPRSLPPLWGCGSVLSSSTESVIVETGCVSEGRASVTVTFGLGGTDMCAHVSEERQSDDEPTKT